MIISLDTETVKEPPKKPPNIVAGLAKGPEELGDRIFSLKLEEARELVKRIRELLK